MSFDPPFSQDELEHIKRLNAQGYFDIEIADDLNCPYHWVYKTRAGVLGLPTVRNSVIRKPAVKSLIERLVGQGYPDNEVAKQAGCSSTTIRKIRRKLGMPASRNNRFTAEKRRKTMHARIRNGGHPFQICCRVRAARLGWPGEDLKTAITLSALEQGACTSNELYERYCSIAKAVTGRDVKNSKSNLYSALNRLQRRDLVDKAGKKPYTYSLSAKALEKVAERAERGFRPCEHVENAKKMKNGYQK